MNDARIKNLLSSATQTADSEPTDWRSQWIVALRAKELGDLDVVDRACQDIVAIEPEFWFARELPKHARGYYAQMGQDARIERFFSERPPRSRCFVEVGAFDGVHYSNVRRLVEVHGWRGISIEPVQKNFLKLQQSYSDWDVTCIRAAVSNRSGSMEMNVSTYPHLPEWGSDVASLHEDDLVRWTRAYAARWDKERVEVKTLTDILAAHGITDVGLLSVDTEGHDLEVLQGLDFTRYAPELVVVEYGSRREELLKFLTRHGYRLEEDNGQDLFMSPIRTTAESVSVGVPAGPLGDHECAIDSIRSRINPHLFRIRHVPEAGTVQVRTVPPIRLMTSRRFDLPAKTIYGRFLARRIQSDWGQRLYLAHLRAFNNLCEGDGSAKTGAAAFVNSFQALLRSVTEEGFDPERSLIPVGSDGNLIDGSHRTAAAYVAGVDVATAVFDRDTNPYDFSYFLKRGLERPYADAMAYEYCLMKTSTFIVSVFPSAIGHDEEVEEVIRRHTSVVYRKDVHLQGEGPHLLMKQMYRDEAWLGNWSSLFSGAKYKADQCFRGDGPVRVFLVDADPLHVLRQCKEELRKLFGIENHSVHINDTYEETVRLAQLYFNENSIHFLNHATLKYFANFYALLDEYARLLDSHRADRECFAIDGSSIMAVYGLREARDIDYFHHGHEEVRYRDPELIGSHNGEIAHHRTTVDDIVFNPEHHFYHDGLKFTSLKLLSDMKARRGEKKDLDDVRAIEPLVGCSTLPEDRLRRLRA